MSSILVILALNFPSFCSNKFSLLSKISSSLWLSSWEFGFVFCAVMVFCKSDKFNCQKLNPFLCCLSSSVMQLVINWIYLCWKMSLAFCYSSLFPWFCCLNNSVSVIFGTHWMAISQKLKTVSLVFYSFAPSKIAAKSTFEIIWSSSIFWFFLDALCINF